MEWILILALALLAGLTWFLLRGRRPAGSAPAPVGEPTTSPVPVAPAATTPAGTVTAAPTDPETEPATPAAQAASETEQPTAPAAQTASETEQTAPETAQPSESAPAPVAEAEPAPGTPVTEPVAAPVDEPVPTLSAQPTAEQVDAPAVLDEPEPAAVTDEPEPAAVETPVEQPQPAPAVESPIERPGPTPAVAATSTAATSGPESADDLRRITGIGPKMATALQTAGIRTYRQLADTDEESLRAIIRGAGLRAVPALPSWPEQARLLATAEAVPVGSAASAS